MGGKIKSFGILLKKFWKHMLLGLLFVVAFILLFTDLQIAIWLQQNMKCLWPYIDRLSNVDGIKAVITAMGAVCFALAFINTARQMRIKGVLIEQVIHKYFPSYGFVFVIHFLFAALGQYSCVIGARATAVICLVGMLFSLLYALHMSLNVVFSKALSEKIVSQYIEDAITKSDSQINKSRLIYQVGQNVAERFLEKDLSPISSFKKKSASETDIIQQLLKLCGMNFNKKVLQNGNFLYQFESIFGDTETNEAVTTDSILYSLPLYLKSQCEFQKSVLQFSQMWQSMFSVINEEYRKAELAYQILCMGKDREETPALCCGLILHLYETTYPYIDMARSTDNFSFCVRLLSTIGRINTISAGETEDMQKAIRIQCRDMLSVFLCLTLLEQANSNVRILSDDFHNAIVNELSQYSGTNTGVYWSDGVLHKYLCYAYSIYKGLTVVALHMPSRVEMSRIIPAVTQTAQSWLS